MLQNHKAKQRYDDILLYKKCHELGEYFEKLIKPRMTWNNFYLVGQKETPEQIARRAKLKGKNRYWPDWTDLERFTYCLDRTTNFEWRNKGLRYFSYADFFGVSDNVSNIRCPHIFGVPELKIKRCCVEDFGKRKFSSYVDRTKPTFGISEGCFNKFVEISKWMNRSLLFMVGIVKEDLFMVQRIEVMIEKAMGPWSGSEDSDDYYFYTEDMIYVDTLNEVAYGNKTPDRWKFNPWKLIL